MTGAVNSSSCGCVPVYCAVGHDGLTVEQLDAIVFQQRARISQRGAGPGAAHAARLIPAVVDIQDKKIRERY